MDTHSTSTQSALAPAYRRPRHNWAFKHSVVAACVPGASIASVAQAHGVSAKLLRRWCIAARAGSAQPSQTAHKPASSTQVTTPAASASFVAVQLAPAPAARSGDIRIELQREGTSVVVSWPSSAAAECGAWLREVLR